MLHYRFLRKARLTSLLRCGVKLILAPVGDCKCTSAGLWVRYDAIWEYGFLEELVGRDKVILQKDFEDILNSGKVGIEIRAIQRMGDRTRLVL